MEVILLERVTKLGQMGDKVKVKNGFARNFLLPKGKALRATQANLEKFENERLQLEARNLELRQEAEKVAEELNDKVFVVIRQAGESGQLYGSVSARDISVTLTENGFSIAKNQVTLQTSIKLIGIHSVLIILHPEVEVAVKLNVARSEEEAERQARGEVLITLEKDTNIVESDEEDSKESEDGESEGTEKQTKESDSVATPDSKTESTEKTEKKSDSTAKDDRKTKKSTEVAKTESTAKAKTASNKKSKESAGDKKTDSVETKQDSKAELGETDSNDASTKSDEQNNDAAESSKDETTGGVDVASADSDAEASAESKGQNDSSQSDDSEDTESKPSG